MSHSSRALAKRLLPVLAALLAAAGPAMAHTGDHSTSTFAAGLAHPLGGWDHVLAMVGVGLWAGVQGGRAVWVWPASFVGVMLLGFGLGAAGIAVPYVEPGILASVVLLGLLAAAALRVPVAAGAAVIAAFAVLHGHAHGAEAPAGGLLPYAAGFALATAGLHGVGLTAAGFGKLTYGRMLARLAGGAVAAGGLALATGLIA